MLARGCACVSQLHWLFWAFHLEMQGANTFFPLWLAGLAFFLVNVGILATLIRHHAYAPLFANGTLVALVQNTSSSNDAHVKTE